MIKILLLLIVIAIISYRIYIKIQKTKSDFMFLTTKEFKKKYGKTRI
jgi:hypothetical protein